jgi:protein TonB
VVALALHAVLIYALIRTPMYDVDGGGGQLADAISVTIVSSPAHESRVPEVVRPNAPAAAAAPVEEIDGAAPMPPTREAKPGDDVEKQEEKKEETPVAQPVPPVEAITEVSAEPEATKREASAPSAGGVSARGDATTPPESAPAGASAGAVRDYSRLVSTILARAKPKTVYETGAVEVEFRIAPDGAITSVGVNKSSGNGKVDDLAVAALQKARLPAPPPGMTAEQLFYRIVYTFKPGGGRGRYR